jgi:hypothetical protein
VTWAGLLIGYKALAGAHRGDGKRYVVRADEKLTAFLELKQRLGFRLRKADNLRFEFAIGVAIAQPLQTGDDNSRQRFGAD